MFIPARPRHDHHARKVSAAPGRRLHAGTRRDHRGSTLRLWARPIPPPRFKQQNSRALRGLEELRLRKEELAHLNAELEDTNRGVMALYAELEERAAHLRLADETKTRFLSAVSHEFRTPVNSILALSKILLHRLDGELTTEQEKASYLHPPGRRTALDHGG